MSTNKKREGINRFACDVSFYDAEKPKASMKYHKPSLPIILFSIVAYGFCWTTFLETAVHIDTRATLSSCTSGHMPSSNSSVGSGRIQSSQATKR